MAIARIATEIPSYYHGIAMAIARIATAIPSYYHGTATHHSYGPFLTPDDGAKWPHILGLIGLILGPFQFEDVLSLTHFRTTSSYPPTPRQT